MVAKLRRLMIALVVGAFPLAAANAQDEVASVGFVSAVLGPASLERAGETLPLSEGTVLAAEDRLLTGEAARVLLVLHDGSRVVIGSETDITLTFLVGAGNNPANEVIDLLQGIIRIDIHVPADRDHLQTRSPTAVVAARSTAWIMEFAADNTAVLALEGTVEVTATTAPGSVLLQPGFGTDVARGAPPTEPVAWGAARVDDVLDRTAFSGIR